ncbi:osm1 [Symbiodinium necroappetens]|uniref:Osm1 protein n=1 Tax=Symbiodinium necroappetens TaxID=1628268 RepID=A0A813BCI7_9DINO|nr:osm1 [Symbiodinium necroappetens]
MTSPDDFNGYGYFYVRLYWTGFGFQANIVEEYILLAALLHVVVALKRTWDISINYTLNSGKMNLALSGISLLTFMMIHLYQFRFGDTKPWKLCPPPYLLNLDTLPPGPSKPDAGWGTVQDPGQIFRKGSFGSLHLNLFWVDTPGCESVYVRDIYRMEFEIFQPLIDERACGLTAYDDLSLSVNHMKLACR